MTVAELLARSRAAHTRYRNASGRINTKGSVSQSPDLRACGQAVREALKARADAQVLDPQFTDPAWHEDAREMRAAHEALMAFYVGYLARAEAA